MLKRDHWTTEEILEIIKSRLEYEESKNPHFEKMRSGYNLALDALIDDFGSCLIPQDIMGAFAYDTERKDFVHIGKIPEDCKISASRNP